MGGTHVSSTSHTTQPARPQGSRGWKGQARVGGLLSWLSLVYRAGEGAIAVTAAIIAGSVALLGFGLDSVIEGLASIIIEGRFTGTRTLSPTAERRAQKAVAVTFFLLAPYIAIDAIHSLVTAEHAKTSWLGIGLSIASLIVMPLLGTAKKRIGARLDSRATIGEGVQNMLCAYLAAAVLAGLLAHTWFRPWSADPVIARGLAALSVHERREAWEA